MRHVLKSSCSRKNFPTLALATAGVPEHKNAVAVTQDIRELVDLLSTGYTSATAHAHTHTRTQGNFHTSSGQVQVQTSKLRQQKFTTAFPTLPTRYGSSRRSTAHHISSLAMCMPYVCMLQLPLTCRMKPESGHKSR